MTAQQIAENKKRIYEMLRDVKFDVENKAGVENLLDYMENGGFFTAPCSGQYHLSEEGGLAQHSLNVYFNMLKLNKALDAGYSTKSIVLCAILHDLGKMGDFGKNNYVPNVLKSGKISETKPYETNKDLLYIDHAIRSVIIAERFIYLTEEEEHAIIFHNGKYTLLGHDLKETPLMMLLHFADLWASRYTEKEDADNE